MKSGALTEVFACGTAAVITPVGHVKFDGGEWPVNGDQTGPVASDCAIRCSRFSMAPRRTRTASCTACSRSRRDVLTRR